jgi:hypothetical protein
MCCFVLNSKESHVVSSLLETGRRLKAEARISDLDIWKAILKRVFDVFVGCMVFQHRGHRRDKLSLANLTLSFRLFRLLGDTFVKL